MRNSLKQLGRGATLFAATSLLMATTAVIPAEAANKAGAACTKANAKTKIGGDGYVMFTFNQIDFKGYYSYKDDTDLYGIDVYLMNEKGGATTM